MFLSCRAWRIAFSGVLIGSVISGSLTAQPITFPTSMSVGDRDLILRAQSQLLRSSDARDWSMHQFRLRLMGIYGLARDWTLFAFVPLVDRELEVVTDDARHRGFGDIEVSVRRTIFERNWLRRTFSISPFFGLRLPTERRTSGSKEVAYQVGFAVRDATFGKPHRFLSAQYTFGRSSNDVEGGDMFLANAALKPPLVGWKTASGESVGMNGMLELNYLQRFVDRAVTSGVQVTGSIRKLSLTPGLVYTRHRWILEFAVQIPVYQAGERDGFRDDTGIVLGVWRNL